MPIITYYTFNYVLIDDKLYRRTADDLLLECLGADQTRIALGKRAPKNKIFYPYSGTIAVIDHGITTRCADVCNTPVLIVVLITCLTQ